MIKILEYCEVERSEIFARTEPCANAEATVRDIISNVRARGDEALLEYGRRFDSPGLDNLTVSAEERSNRSSPSFCVFCVRRRTISASFTSVRSETALL